MTIPCSLSPLGTVTGKYRPGEEILRVGYENSATVTLYPGVYKIYAQGAGAGGGNNDYFANGNGGGSGAGFKGYIRVKRKMTITVQAHDRPEKETDGGDTTISGIMTLGGGKKGLNGNAGASGKGGTYTIHSSTAWEIKETEILSNGYDGVIATNEPSFQSGANSILSNSGGGLGNADATGAGAGGGGGYSWHSAGGKGGWGECIIWFWKY